MAKMTKKKLIELIRESVDECMNITENCPPDMGMEPMEQPMEPMAPMDDEMAGMSVEEQLADLRSMIQDLLVMLCRRSMTW